MSARLALIAALVAALPAAAAAHTLSDGYVELTADGAEVTGRIDLAARDLHDAIGLDDGDGALRWREIDAAAGAIRSYVASHVGLATAAGPCRVVLGDLAAVERADGRHVAIALVAHCPGPADPLTVDYRAIVAIDAQHRGLVRFTSAGGTTVAVASGAPVTVRGATPPRVLDFIVEGVWHIWAGLDHVAFLLALLLPAVFVRRARTWQPAPALGGVVRDVLEIVTAFTLAHSITLILATVGWVRLPPRLVETGIALSVAAAAANNVWRVVDARWAVAFALGLLHGFGFSSVLAELGVPGAVLGRALLGFNLGVELGQAAIVAVFLPLAFAVRTTRAYRVATVIASIALVAVALHWALERVTA